MFGIARAPEIDRPGLQWFNTPRPLSLADLKGRIVILDFWTYCCINCMHVLPTLRRVEEAFPEDVAVIGVHSPKFAAERRPGNLAQAIARYDVRHPVVHDPMMILWQDYAVHAWPTLVFLSPDGYVIGNLPGEPDPEALVHGIGDMVRQFREQGDLSPRPLPLVPPMESPSRLRFPAKIKACPGPDGEAWWAVADAGHHQIVLFADDGVEMVRYGSGHPGFRDGPPGEAEFCNPQGLCCDDRAIWVADTGNHALRRIDRHDGRVTTVAGLGRRGPPLKTAEPGEGAALASPWDVEQLGGSIYFANAGTHQIGRYDPATSMVLAVAGTSGEDIADGPAERALLAQPSALIATPDRSGLYFADAETSSIRLLSLGPRPCVKTLVGQGLFTFGHQNGPFDHALLQHPLALALADGGLVVADSYNGALRRLDLRAGEVEDIDPGHCTDPLCHPAGEPAGIAAAGAERLLVADTNNHRIVEIDLAARRNRTWAG